jgi:hypothetical protein
MPKFHESKYSPPQLLLLSFFKRKTLPLFSLKTCQLSCVVHDTKQNFVVRFDVSNFFIETKQIENIRSKEGEEEKELTSLSELLSIHHSSNITMMSRRNLFSPS